MDAFDRIANKFDTTFERRIENSAVAVASRQMEAIEEEKNELMQEVNGLPQITIKDQSYLEDKTKTLIEKTERVLSQLEKDMFGDSEGLEAPKITPNMKVAAYNAFSCLSNSVSMQIRELRELNKMVLGMDMMNSEVLTKKYDEEQQLKSKTIKMSSSDLLKLINEAKNSNQLNAVNAEYKVIQ